MLKKPLLATVGAACISIGVSEAARAANFTLVASGLDNPKGFAFGSDGSLYVTEAGRGGPPSNRCISSPSQPGANLCYGPTGAITRIKDGISERVVTGLPSIGLPNGNGSYGPHDIAFDSAGKAYALIGFATNPVRDDASVRDTIIGDSNLAQVLEINSFDERSSWTQVADLAEFELLNDPDGTGLIINPYSFVLQDDNTAFAVDSGANDVLRVGLDGNGIELEAVLGMRAVTDPVSGEEALMQTVPSAITVGPDGAYYVSEFTGRPYPENEARIYRFTPGNELETYADGFTQVIDLAFDSQDNMYVLQYTDESLSLNASRGILDRNGSLIRVTSDGTRETVVDEGLVSPNSILIDSNDSIYISNYGTFAGRGEIVRVDNSVSVPEASSTVGTLAASTLGAAWLWLRKRKAADAD